MEYPPDSIQRRLDRAGDSHSWKAMSNGARVFHRDFFGSDHRAIHVILNFFPQSVSGRDRRERRFIFDPVWRTKEEYREVDSRAWLQSPTGGDG